MTDTTDLVADGWEPILAAALLGAERAPPGLPGSLAELVTEPDSGNALLARLALHGIHHLAGLDLAPEAMEPVETRETAGPECPPAAAIRLYALLTGGHAARERLREWFDLAAAAQVRPPAWLHQALMLQAGNLPETAGAVVGHELAWLAEACGENRDGPAAEAPADWTEGRLAERRAAFLGFRARDPEGARTALEAVFRKEKADAREALVGALWTGLSPDDAPFLETCLDDRAGGVREAAQRLLPRLPRSLYASRMAVRATAALVIESKTRLLRSATHELVVTLPTESPTLARDGVTPNPGSSAAAAHGRACCGTSWRARRSTPSRAIHRGAGSNWPCAANGPIRSSRGCSRRWRARAILPGRRTSPTSWRRPTRASSPASGAPTNSSPGGCRPSTCCLPPNGRRG